MLLLALTALFLLESIGCADPATYTYNTDYAEDIAVDHFSYTNTDKFKIRYLYNLTYYKPGGPILFYPGNEGDIVSFALNSGIVWDVAPLFNAAVVFTEHRYWGESLPYGDDSFTDLSRIGYMTSVQVIADYKAVLEKFKQKFEFPDKVKILAIGGSYGGMLGAWMKLKYPAFLTGVWASSAPVVWFNSGNVSIGGYGARVKKAFQFFGCKTDALFKGFQKIQDYGRTAEMRQTLTEIFSVDPKTPLVDQNSVKNLLNYVHVAVETMAMTNYPYETQFLKKLPPYPLKVGCGFVNNLSGAPSDEDYLNLMKNVANIYYNYTGKLETACLVGQVCGGGDSKKLYDVWDFQKCTEIIIELCEMGPPNDFFLPQCTDRASFLQFRKQFCRENYAKLGWTEGLFNENGIRDIYGLDYTAAANIIFTNAGLDPWGAGGVMPGVTPGIAGGEARGIYTLDYEGSAHHLDIRQPNSCDPDNVSNVRYQVVQIFKCWLDASGPECPFKTRKVPDFKFSANLPNCVYIFGGYPWNQTSSP